MKRICSIKSLFFLLVVIFISCACERYEPLSTGVDCTECYQQRPEWVQLNAKVSINAENQYVPLVVYIGNIEDNVVDWVDTTYHEDYWLDVKPDRYYSVKAKYKDGSTVIYAIDGDEIKLKRTSSDCDEECYYQKGGFIDVSLRN